MTGEEIGETVGSDGPADAAAEAEAVTGCRRDGCRDDGQFAVEEGGLESGRHVVDGCLNTTRRLRLNPSCY